MSDLISNIKNLREISGAGFLDCKKTLEENNNDIEKSIDSLRKKGLSKASKKSTRVANDGAVGVFASEEKTLLIEINSETDFAAKNELFIQFIEKIGNFALQLKIKDKFDLNHFMETKFEDRSISNHLTEIISVIGENIVLRRINFLLQDNKTKIFSYTHNAYKDNIGKICVALKADIDNQNEDTLKFGKYLCMQIAATKPLAINIEDLDKKLIDKERKIQLETIRSSGKPDNIIEKILIGKMNKFYSEVTLLNQNYILDNDKTVKKVIDEFNSTKGKFNIIDYSYFVLGS